MARYVITTLAIVTIILAAADSASAALPSAAIESPASPVDAGLSEGREFTILTYNTHLFEDSILECICRCGEIPSPDSCTWADYNYDDGGRRTQIVNRIRASGADIVALEEVWALWWQRWFLEDLQDTYPYTPQYTATFDSSCPCAGAFGWSLNACLDNYICDFPFYYCCKSPFYPGTVAKKNTLGNGLVLLSKFPLSDVNFVRFPVFEQCDVGKCEAWSDKGVLTATVNVNGAPIRIGISHALTGPDDYKSKWDTNYFATATASFQLNGEAYIFGLDSQSKGHILKMEDYGRDWDEKNKKYNYGAGWKHICERHWGADYVDVTPFELDGHPYLFAVNDSNKGRITKINYDPSTGWTHLHTGDWGSHCVAVASFELGGRPYLFSVDDSNSAHITRINENPSTGWSDTATDTWPSEYASIASFELDGHPYIFAHNSDQGRIIRINDDPNAGWSAVYEGGAMSFVGYATCKSFELDGHPYLFGLNANNNAYILRINNDPCTGWTYTYKGPDDENLTAWYRFEGDSNDSSGNNHHPYEFGAPTYNADSREGGLSIELDGVDDYLRVGPVGKSGSSQVTIAGWVKATKPAFQIPGWANVFGFTYTQVNYTHFDIQRSNNSDHYCIHAYNWVKNIAPLDMEWHHLAATYDGKKTKAWYHDGYLVGTDPGGGIDIADNVQIGKRYDIDNFFPGLVDDVRIYNRALSQGEIAELAGWGDIAVFEMNGHPYLFALRNCCDQMDAPGCFPVPCEAYLKRVNDDGKGWENLYQLEDMKIIRDATVVEDGPPAIMMGDFNIHRSKYGIMDKLFRKAGAVDAYIEVHGTGEGGETIDLHNNKLAPKFCKDDPLTPKINECNTSDPNVYPTEMTIDRIDYVYVKPSGAGLRLVPTDAYVDRGWTYRADNMDLSDHYPLFAKFRLETGCKVHIKGDFDCDGFINFPDLAILCSAWLSEPGSGVWDRACDISDPGDDFIDMKDFDSFARQWQTMAVHNVTQDKGYVSIQASINDANDGDEIKVAPGTYYEAINFKGKPIRLYSSGGQNVTTIDGSGAYHVVQCINHEDANTILEGFTITGGNANGPTDADKCGGGMYNNNSSPTVTNCTFINNSVNYHGGGMHNITNSSPTVTNCTFSGNTAINGGGMHNVANSSPTVTNCTLSGNSASYGGGMGNWSSSNPTVTNCTFSQNSAVTYGGGMFNQTSSPAVTNCAFIINTADYGGGMFNYGASSPTVTNCTFSGNTSVNEGGGMRNYSSSPTVTNCTFTGNQATFHGGGICNVTSSSPTLTNCVFSANEAGGYGGGMINSVSSSPTVTGCTFCDNTAGDGGGMFNNDKSNPIVTNCIFTDNSAIWGGGMYNYKNSDSTVANCTFIGNSASASGGGMINNVSSTSAVTNCIFWTNTPNEILNYDGHSPATVTYSDVKGGFGGTGNINADPLFVDANGGNLRLSSGSPCIDKGSNAGVPPGITTDLDGNPRVSDGDSNGTVIVDMGAYEYLVTTGNSLERSLEACCILAAHWLEGTEPEL